MDYQKAQRDLSKLKEMLTKYQTLFAEDGHVDTQEQQKLDSLQEKITQAETAIEEQMNGSSSSKSVEFEGPISDAPETTTGAGSRFDEKPEEVEQSGEKSDEKSLFTTTGEDSKLTEEGSSKGVGEFLGGFMDGARHLLDRSVGLAADALYSALHAAARKTNCVIAITASSTISPGAISFSAEDGCYMTPNGDFGLVRGIGVTMAADDLAEAYTSGGSSLLKSLLTDGGLSAGVNLTFIFDGKLSNLGGTAYAAGVGAQIGPTNFDGNVLFGSAADLAALRNPTGFILAGGISLLPGLDVDLNFTRAEAWLN